MYLVGRRAGSWECPHPLGSLTSLGVPERGCVCVCVRRHIPTWVSFQVVIRLFSRSI